MIACVFGSIPLRLDCNTLTQSPLVPDEAGVADSGVVVSAVERCVSVCSLFSLARLVACCNVQQERQLDIPLSSQGRAWCIRQHDTEAGANHSGDVVALVAVLPCHLTRHHSLVDRRVLRKDSVWRAAVGDCWSTAATSAFACSISTRTSSSASLPKWCDVV
jgi:hypothetical protein